MPGEGFLEGIVGSSERFNTLISLFKGVKVCIDAGRRLDRRILESNNECINSGSKNLRV